MTESPYSARQTGYQREQEVKEWQHHHQVLPVNDDEADTDDEPRQVGQLVTGLVGTAVGTVTSPILGAFSPLVGALIGNVVGEAITNATSMALGRLESE